MLHDEYNKIFPEKTVNEIFEHFINSDGLFIKKQNFTDKTVFELSSGYAGDGEYTWIYSHEDYETALRGLILKKFFYVDLLSWEHDKHAYFSTKHRIRVLKDFLQTTESKAVEYYEQYKNIIDEIANFYNF